jgi:hypothetical protein
MAPDDELWGRGFAWENDELAAAAVFTAAMVFEAREPPDRVAADEAGRRLSTRIDEWATSVVSWLEVITGLDLDPHEPLDEHVNQFLTYATRFWDVSSEGESTWYPVNPRRFISIGGNAEQAISKRLWKKAVAAANAATRLPDEYLLIRNAKRALRRERTRFAVLDAATAADMAINGEVRRLLKSDVGEGTTDEILKQISQAVRLIPLLQSLGVALPSTSQAGLFDLRNRVIHRNVGPTTDEAKDAVAIASVIVSRCVQLPAVS